MCLSHSFLALTLLLPCAISRADTSCRAHLDSCSYYSCREELEDCGADGYWLRLGLSYCQSLSDEVSPRLSADGQAWMSRASQCLRERADQIPTRTACDFQKGEAIETHLDCYVRTGFCQISFDEKILVLKHIYQELVDPRFLSVLTRITAACAR